MSGQILVRIDTNQGISGYGEMYNGGVPPYALMLKSRILGENPCNVEKIFRKIKQFGGQARQGGGVTAVEQACWDIAGQAYGVPFIKCSAECTRQGPHVHRDSRALGRPERDRQRSQGARRRRVYDAQNGPWRGVAFFRGKPGTFQRRQEGPWGRRRHGRELHDGIRAHRQGVCTRGRLRRSDSRGPGHGHSPGSRPFRTPRNRTASSSWEARCRSTIRPGWRTWFRGTGWRSGRPSPTRSRCPP